jgi:hypothetical protein
MACTAWLVVNVSNASSCHKNIGSKSGNIYWPGPPVLSASLPCLCPLLGLLLKLFFVNFIPWAIYFYEISLVDIFSAFFWFMRVLDLDRPRTYSQIWLYSVHWGGNKWPWRPLGGELQCGGLRPLCEGLLGGSSFEEGVGQPARVS